MTADVITSAFLTAGQRCSALRLLCLHEDVAPAMLEMLQGAMDELVIGDPADPATDVGPVIDDDAQARLEATSVAARRLVLAATPARIPGRTSSPRPSSASTASTISTGRSSGRSCTW